MDITFNIGAIITAAVISLIAGFLWFTMLFKNTYIKDLGRSQAQMENGPSLLIASGIQLLGNIVLAFVLSWLIQHLGYTSLPQTLQLAIMLWLGFVVAVIGPFYAFQAFSLRFFLIIVGGVLSFILITTIIITVWR